MDECCLKMAVPNEVDYLKIHELFKETGLTITKSERSLYAKTHDGNYTLIFVRTQDIPKFVSDEVMDLGVTARM